MDNEEDSKRSQLGDQALEAVKPECKDEAEPDALAFDDDNNRSIFSGTFQHSINNENKSNSS